MSKKQIPHHLSRRDFLRNSAVAVSGLALGGASFLTSNLSYAGKPRTVIRNPLFIPNTVSPSSLSLTEAPARVDLGGGQFSSVWAYNGSFPGPTLQARRGDRAVIELTNGLSEMTITHWHGMIVDDINDGHPRFAFPPGAKYNYNFLVDQRACLNWYHPHPHQLTGEQVNLGLAGAFIVRDNEEDALGLPSGRYEVPLIIRDATLDSSGNLKYSASKSGFSGSLSLVNGTLNPFLNVDTALYRFRILNGANARVFRLALSNAAPFTLIGNDGGLLEQSTQVAEIIMAPAERIDVIVDFSGLAVGDRVLLQDLNAGWDLLEFVVSQQVNVGGSIPTVLSSIPKLSPNDVVTTRTFSFDGMSKINGQVYDVNRIDAQVPLGHTERWIFTTGGNAPHPVHVHASPFQVQSRTGGSGTVQPWEQGWKDTVLLGDGEQIEVLVRFDAFRGIYLMHCHKLEHEDAGMMMNFEII